MSTTTVHSSRGSFTTAFAPVPDPGGTHSRYLVFHGQASGPFAFGNLTSS